MNIEKIEINGHYVWVDKDSDIEQNEYLYDKNFGISKARWSVINSVAKNDQWKIIAASPELNLEGVPSYVEWLAEQETIRNEWNSEKSFIKGYQTAEKELPTWDDVRKAIELTRGLYLEDSLKANMLRIDKIEKIQKEIIEQLKQSK